MNVYAISDLHLSAAMNKPMDVFGDAWHGHFDKIRSDWSAKVGMDDVVLLCGDTSWGMTLNDGLADLRSLADLPGKKVFCRGNHDFWWNGITTLRDNAPDDSFFFLQNDCVRFGDVVVCGSRGWTCPGSAEYTDHDEKIYLREAERFRLCRVAVEKIREEGDTLIVMSHFPPFSVRNEHTLFTDMFRDMRAEKVVFGHIHGETYFPLRTFLDGTEYLLTSCDKLNFSLIRLM